MRLRAAPCGAAFLLPMVGFIPPFQQAWAFFEAYLLRERGAERGNERLQLRQ